MPMKHDFLVLSLLTCSLLMRAHSNRLLNSVEMSTSVNWGDYTVPFKATRNTFTNHCPAAESSFISHYCPHTGQRKTSTMHSINGDEVTSKNTTCAILAIDEELSITLAKNEQSSLTANPCMLLLGLR